MRKGILRRGFTLIETVTVIVVIAILAALGMLGVDEFVASAKATKIINNLYTLQKATWAWYADNKDKVTTYTGKINGKNWVAGMVMLDGVNPHPIQELSDEQLKLSKYIERVESGTKINLNHVKQTVPGTSRVSTYLGVGYYGICDGGTVRDKNNSSVVKEYRRNLWYAGYRFKPGEEKVKEKIKGRMKSIGILFGTADAHLGEKEGAEDAVWLRVR